MAACNVLALVSHPEKNTWKVLGDRCTQNTSPLTITSLNWFGKLQESWAELSSHKGFWAVCPARWASALSPCPPCRVLLTACQSLSFNGAGGAQTYLSQFRQFWRSWNSLSRNYCVAGLTWHQFILIVPRKVANRFWVWFGKYVWEIEPSYEVSIVNNISSACRVREKNSSFLCRGKA